MTPPSDRPSRFGPVAASRCLGLVYYLWRFTFSDPEREARLDDVPEVELRDLVAAVRPWIDELEVALEREDLAEVERAGLAELGATWQAAFDRLGGREDRIKEGWNILQVTGDRPLNHALWKLFRAEDLHARSVPGDLETEAEVQELLAEGFHELTALMRTRTFHRLVAALQERFRERAVIAMRIVGERAAAAPGSPPEGPPEG